MKLMMIYCLFIGYYQQSEQRSVIVNQQSSQPNFILNPAGITSNPYIPSISGGHPVHPNSGSPYNYMSNPNGMNLGPPPAQPSSSGVIVYDNKNLSHNYQHH